MATTDDDDFILVNPRKAAKKKRYKTIECLDNNVELNHISKSKIAVSLGKNSKELHESEILKSAQECLTKSQSLLSSRIERIVCYGIGSLASSIIARYQFTLLTILRETLEIPKSKCELYDPILTEDEVDIIENNGFNVITHNEEGKRAVTSPTLFYLPHCGKALYNNLLWTNWAPQSLKHCFIIGNSFAAINERTPSRILNKQASLVKKIITYTTELPLSNHFHMTDIFNDSSLHVFLPAALEAGDQEFWKRPPEPVYDVDDLEIVLSNVKIKD